MGNTISAPELSPREGYTFLGWYKGDSLYNFNDIVTENIVLTAKWKKNQYTVTWNVDGNITTETYEYGEMPTFKDSLIKMADNTYTYNFKNWDKSITSVEKDVTYTAVFESTYIEYTIIFENEDGTEISNETYHYGDTIVVPKDPTKPNTAEYTYTFSGWNETVSKTVNQNKTYTATYTSTLNQYMVTWNVDGNTTTETYEYGEMPTFKGSLTKMADNTYTYDFKNWDKSITSVEKDVTYTAVFESTYIEYTIIFENEDGTEISNETYHYGDTIVVPKDPTKPNTAEYTYTFVGWTEEVATTVTENKTYRAEYDAIINRYTVSFYDEYGILVSKTTVKYGEMVEEPQTPTKNNYIFLGWYNGEELYDFNKPILGDISLKTKWLQKINISIDNLVTEAYTTIKNQVTTDKFTVSQKEHTITVSIVDTTMDSLEALEGTGVATAAKNLLNTEGVKEVTLSAEGATPVTVNADNLFEKLNDITDLFLSMAGEEGTANELIGQKINILIELEDKYMTSDNKEFEIIFTNELNTNELINESYLIIQENESVDKFQVYKSSNSIKINLYDLTMDSLEALEGTGVATAAKNLLNTEGVKEVTLSAEGATPVTINADNLFEKLNDITDLFLSIAGEEGTAKELIGHTINVEITLDEGYYTNSYQYFIILFAEPDSYQVSFNTDGGTYITPQMIYYESTLEIPQTPTKEGHTFNYWSFNGVEFDFNTPITEDIELTAIWIVNEYIVIFKDSDGTEISNEKYYYGEEVVFPDNPSKADTELYKYTFTGWDNKLTTVIGNAEYNATYTVSVNIDKLVNISYDVIYNQAAADKFIITKENNVIVTNIIDLTLDSLEALEGTGVATAAKNLLQTDGVESVTITADNLEPLTLSADDILDKMTDIQNLFISIAGNEEATAEELVGKAIKITINLKDGYVPQADPTFAILFVSNIKMDEIVNNSYNTINNQLSNEDYNVELHENNIDITVLNTYLNARDMIAESKIIDVIKNILLIPGIESISLSKNNKDVIVVTSDNLITTLPQIQYLLNNLVSNDNSTTGALAGNTIEIILNNQDNYIFVGEPKITISYDAVYDITYNVDNQYTTEKIAYNDLIVEPTVPQKEGYTFSHWELNGTVFEFNVPATSSIELVAVWNINKYNISFTTNNDAYGTVDTKEIEVCYGDIINIIDNKLVIDNKTISAIPAESNAQYTYAFTNWYGLPTNNKIVGDIRITANFNETINEYTITWNVDGNITKETYEYGEMPTYKGSLDKSPDNTYTYEFKDWDKSITSVEKDVTYTAIYESTYIDYTIIFEDADGTEISNETYHYGDTIVVPKDPIKANTAEYTYSFAGWSETVSNTVTESKTYTATYTNTLNQYIVTWNVDGKITKETYDYGEIPTYKESLNKIADNTYTYEFKDWDKAITSVEKDVTYTAIFESTYIEYTITFKFENGTEDYVQTYHYGDTIVVPANPSKESTDEYTYTFTGWSETISPTATESKTYVAKYSATTNKYIVTWNVDGNITTETYDYGEIPTYKGSLDKLSDNTYTYEFKDWDKSITSVEKDVTYTAVYESTYIDYTIIFEDEDGTEISNETYHYGDTIIVPKDPTKANTAEYTYSFAGWSETVSNTVTESKTYTATYTQTKNKYKITFKNWDHTLLEEKEVEYGVVPTYTGNTPTKASTKVYKYTFNNWDKQLTSVTGAATYIAQYTEDYVDYTITFKFENGTSDSVTTYHYGDTIIVPPNPTKTKTAQYTYTFTGWNETVSPTVTESKTYTAQYSSTINKYTVTWNENGLITTETYEYGSLPTYKNNKAGDDSCGTYVPDTSPKIKTVTGDITYVINHYDCQIDVNSILESKLAALDTGGLYTVNDTIENNEIYVTLTSKAKYTLLPSFFSSALEIFETFTTEESYESVMLHTLYDGHTTPLEPDIDLINSGFDYSKTGMNDWSDGGCNADLADWLGYLVTGQANNASGMMFKRLSVLSGKQITVTIQLKEGYVNTDNEDTIVYELYFV